MTSSNTLSSFHQWWLASPASQCASRTIVLHGGPHETFDSLICDIADYLNEYDEEGAGRWLAATSQWVAAITNNPESLGLLLNHSSSSNGISPEPSDFLSALTAIGQRGHVIFCAYFPNNTSIDLPAAFHAGIGNADCECAKCHLVLNPELVQPQSLAHIVSDVFLDWQDEARRRGLPETSRYATPSAFHEQNKGPNPAPV